MTSCSQDSPEQEEGAPHPGEGRQQQAALDPRRRRTGAPIRPWPAPAQQLGVVGEYSSGSTGGRRDGALLTGEWIKRSCGVQTVADREAQLGARDSRGDAAGRRHRPQGRCGLQHPQGTPTGWRPTGRKEHRSALLRRYFSVPLPAGSVSSSWNAANPELLAPFWCEVLDFVVLDRPGRRSVRSGRGEASAARSRRSS